MLLNGYLYHRIGVQYMNASVHKAFTDDTVNRRRNLATSSRVRTAPSASHSTTRTGVSVLLATPESTVNEMSTSAHLTHVKMVNIPSFYLDA